MYKNSLTIYGVKIITDNSNCHPFLDPLYIAPFVGDNPTEHSRNIPRMARLCGPRSLAPRAREDVTVYGAKLMIECEMCASTFEKDRSFSLYKERYVLHHFSKKW